MKASLSSILFIWLISGKLFATHLPDSDFTATYEAGKYSTIVAEMTLSLSRQGEQVTYLSKTQPRGLLALVSSDRIIETSIMQYHQGNGLRLQNYSYSRKERPRDNQQYQLHWLNDKNINIQGKFNKQAIQLSGSAPIWDNLSVQLALMSDASANAVFNSKYNYTVVHKGQLKHYQFEFLSVETLQVNGKTYKTLKMKRQHGSSGERISYFWLASELDNLPVKIEQHKNAKLGLTIQLSDYKKKSTHD